MVLAGGNDQAALIQELRQIFEGCEIILIDFAKEVIASQYADKHLVISTMDIDAVKEAAIKEQVDYILTACGDQPLLTMAVVSEELGLPCYLSKKQVLDLTNKMYMKKKMVANDIPTSKFKTFTSCDKIDITGLNFPLIVKPVDSNGSKGVRKVTNYDELKEQANIAIKFALSDTIIVEEFVNGIEISLDYYVIDGKAIPIMMSTLNKCSVNESISVIYQTIIPPVISETARLKMNEIAQKIADAFEISNSPVLIQSIINGDNVNVIEFSSRIGGGAKYKDIENHTGFNILKANILSMLGKTPIVELNDNSNVSSRCHLYMKSGIFSNIVGIQELLDEGLIEEYVQTKPFGVKVNAPKSSSDRVASIFINAADNKSLKTKIISVLNRIHILDECGRDVFERDMYLSEEALGKY